MLSKRSQSEKCEILYDSNYMTFWERKNDGDIKKIIDWEWLWGSREIKGRDWWITEDF